jgi:hypothetical protein
LLSKRTQTVVQFLRALVIFRDWSAGIHFEAQILDNWKIAKLVLTHVAAIGGGEMPNKREDALPPWRVRVNRQLSRQVAPAKEVASH